MRRQAAGLSRVRVELNNAQTDRIGREECMLKEYAIDLAKKLYREHNRSYFVIKEEDSEEYRVVDKAERDEQRLNRYIVFGIEID